MRRLVNKYGIANVSISLMMLMKQIDELAIKDKGKK